MAPSILHRVRATSERFASDKRGSLAVFFAVMLLPLLVAVGCVLDYARLTAAAASAQAAVDTAALAAAKTDSDNPTDMRKAAERFVAVNTDGMSGTKTEVPSFTYNPTSSDISIVVQGSISTSFMNLVNISTLNYEVKSSATRSPPGTTEVALVLDNTWSMSGSKLTALKKSATDLVATLKKNPKADVKIALVPYADYVNVGVQNRSKSWISVAADYDVTKKGTCSTITQKCVKGACVKGAKKTCTRYVDGVAEDYDCTPTTCAPDVCTPVTPYQQCTSDSVQNYRWYGCVASRNVGTLRLNDTQGSVPYKGLAPSTSRNCLNPIVPLTDSSATINAAIAGMIVNVGSYKPSTYIPAGLIWGVNVLSQTEPFAEGKAYDPKNQLPRKALVLMTDGANTLYYRASDGLHPAGTGTQLNQSYADMVSICDYAKSNKIEVFTVSFSVEEQIAKDTLVKCASGADHAFSADNEQALAQAFKNIADSLSNIRLTR